MPLQHTGIWILLLVHIIVPPSWICVIRPLRHMVAVARRLGLRHLMAQKERLLTDVSHEIRGPVSPILRPLARALANVLDNAIKYTPAGGTARALPKVPAAGWSCSLRLSREPLSPSDFPPGPT